MTLSHLKRLFEHMSWADRAAAAALTAAPEPPPLALATYAHVLGAELVWIDRLEGLPQSVAVWPGADLAACRDLADRAQRRYAAYLALLTEPDLDRPVPYTNSAGQSFETRAGDILLHVALHGSYHRGQVAQLLRAAGAVPAATDYIGFVRGVPAATRRDAPR
jgi:uncharacterized damage-inducible protein DinB